MSHDYSRIRFDHRDDYFGVQLQQGRPLTDADWNESVAQTSRRAQAAALDTMGPTMVSEQTPDGFKVQPTAEGFTIGRGRIYVDGLLAENHGSEEVAWDVKLAEDYGQLPIAYAAQPYLPNPPALVAGEPYLVYVDVWQREVGHLQDENLIDIAIGVDTTARLQTVWQVRALPVPEYVHCSSPIDEVTNWNELTAPSSGRLTTATGNIPGEPDPCLVPPAGGYKGAENQLYRVEVHEGGAPGIATFKWSRDNASVQARVLRIPDLTHLVLDSVGKDEVLRFNEGDWIEVLDDALELNGRPGILRRIALVGGVDDATRTITLEQPLPAGQFAVDAQGVPVGNFHTRVRRWNQAGIVKRADGSTYTDLNEAGSTGAITIPTGSTDLLLENGILVSFSRAEGRGVFRTGDWWAFAARATDASIEVLDAAPPRGIHHHFAKLAVVRSLEDFDDCRTVGLPQKGCCTVVVRPGESIQAAINSLRHTGGCICLKNGTHRIADMIRVPYSGITVHGESQAARIVGGALPLLAVEAEARDVELASITFESTAAVGETYAAVVAMLECERVRMRDCIVRYLPVPVQTVPMVGVWAVGNDLALTGNRIENCYVGVLSFDSDIVIERNVMQGMRVLFNGEVLPQGFGVYLDSGADARCRENVFEDFFTGVMIFPGSGAVSVVDNDIRRRAWPELGQPQNVSDLYFAIIAGADNSYIHGNRIDLASRNYGGVLVSGRHVQVTENRFSSTYGTPSLEGPMGVYVGSVDSFPRGEGDFAAVAQNHFTGLQLPVVANSAQGVQVVQSSVRGVARDGLGIWLKNCTASLVANNQVIDVALPLVLTEGSNNRVLDNNTTTTRFGAVFSNEQSLTYRGNSIEDAALMGIGIEDASLTTTFAQSHIANCGYEARDFALGVVSLGSVGALDFTLESCSVLNTGRSPNADRETEGLAYGVVVLPVLRAQILNNRILYEEVRADLKILDSSLPHLALLMVGGHVSTGNEPQGQLGPGGAHIMGNVIEGASLAHLIFVTRMFISDKTDLRFEKLTFANNRCEHLTRENDSDPSIELFATMLNVTGNFVNTVGNNGASFRLGNRPNTVLLGNVTTNGILAFGTTVPTPHTQFNVNI